MRGIQLAKVHQGAIKGEMGRSDPIHCYSMGRDSLVDSAESE